MIMSKVIIKYSLFNLKVFSIPQNLQNLPRSKFKKLQNWLPYYIVFFLTLLKEKKERKKKKKKKRVRIRKSKKLSFN